MNQPRLCMLALVAAAGCSNAAGGDDPQPQSTAPARLEKPGLVQFHMRQHFGDLRQIERLLLAGKLEDARSLAFMLTKPATDPGIAPWAEDIGAVTAAAHALVAAPGTDEALRREARVAAACAQCHVHTQVKPVFPAAPPVPSDDGTSRARMARHQWAADRLWEGVVGGADKPWRAGLEVLAASPLPYSSLTDAPALAAQLQGLAHTAIDERIDRTDPVDERARMYGEILVTCAGCHTSLRTPRRSP